MADSLKISFNIPKSPKEQFDTYKDELDMSLSAMFREALEEYIKERERWKNSSTLASRDYEANSELTSTNTKQREI